MFLHKYTYDDMGQFRVRREKLHGFTEKEAYDYAIRAYDPFQYFHHFGLGRK